MKGPEYYIGKLFGKEPSETKVKRKRTDSKGNTIIDSTIDGKPVTRRRIEGIGSVTKDRRQYDKPIGPKNKPEQTFGQAFAAARKAGKKQFMYKGELKHTRTKEEEAKAKSAKTETKATPKAKKTMSVGKPGYNRRTIEKAMGGSMCKKTTKKAMGGSMSSKPKGVGCATRGYGKAMK
jgi:hypothetical protein